MQKICAWCKQPIEATTTGTAGDTADATEICIECERRFVDQDINLRDFIESLSIPIVAVDGGGDIELANKEAIRTLQREFPDNEKPSCGVFFGCAYAKLPEGCGKTKYCPQCTIRNTVLDTFKSGDRHVNTRALLNYGTLETMQPLLFSISTQKFGEVVVLKIDSMGTA